MRNSSMCVLQIVLKAFSSSTALVTGSDIYLVRKREHYVCLSPPFATTLDCDPPALS